MTHDSKRSSTESPMLDYAHARPPRSMTPDERRERLNRRERVAAFWILGAIVAVPFLTAALLLLMLLVNYGK